MTFPLIALTGHLKETKESLDSAMEKAKTHAAELLRLRGRIIRFQHDIVELEEAIARLKAA